MKTKISVYVNTEEHKEIKESASNENKTITAYCKEKILSTPKENHLNKHILRQFEDLLYLLISQQKIDSSLLTNKTMQDITSRALYVAGLKAHNNSKAKKRSDVGKSSLLQELFKILDIKAINELILKVNQEANVNRKNKKLGEYILKIRDILIKRELENEKKIQI
jgi:hypothetical protein